MNMNKQDKIYIAGHTGLVGSALTKRLKESGFKNIVTKISSELDLTNQTAVGTFFQNEKPDYVFLLAAKVGGIVANTTQPAYFIQPNLLIENNVIDSAYKVNVKKLFFLACSIIYPKECEQPIKEEYLFLGKPEPTNIAHTIAKIAGIVLCQSYNKQYNTNFISAVASNIYGPNNDFDSNSGHVIPSMVSKFHNAKIKNESSITLWGTGKPCRDFIYVEDIVDASLFLMENYNSSEIINISSGKDTSIAELGELLKDIISFKGKIIFDVSKPDGAMRRILDNSKIKSLGWQPKNSLKEGLEKTYHWWVANLQNR